MASYRVEVTLSAKKEFDRLPKKVQDKVLEALRFLAENPYSDLLKIKKLRAVESLYRVRIGDYRVVYEVRSVAPLVVVIKIGHRREIYRRI